MSSDLDGLDAFSLILDRLQDSHAAIGVLKEARDTARDGESRARSDLQAARAKNNELTETVRKMQRQRSWSALKDLRLALHANGSWSGLSPSITTGVDEALNADDEIPF